MNIFTNTQFLGAFLMMVVCVGAGFIMRRKGIISQEGRKTLTALIYKLAVPCLAFSSFMKDYSASDMRAGLASLIASFIFYLLFSAVCGKIFKSVAAGFLCGIGQLTLFAMPLLRASGSETAVLYCGIMTLSFRVCVYGISSTLLTGNRKIKDALLSPIMLSMLLGLVCWIGQGLVPFVRLDKSLPAVYSVLDTLSDLVCPLGMLLIGVNIGESRLYVTFADARAWICAVIKAALCPLIVLAVTKLLPNVFDAAAVLALTMGFAAPSSITVSAFCTAAGHDEEFSGHVVILSTILCAVTIPLLGLLI